MSTSADPALRQDYWPLPVLRAVPAAVAGLVITFSAEHSSRFGLLVFGGFALVTGILVLAVSRLRLARSGVRGIVGAQGITSVLAGIAALLVREGGIASLLLVVTGWAVVTGALELYSGIRTRRRHPASVDWITAGAMTLVAGIVFFAIPPDYAQRFTGPDGVERVLDASVVAVGAFGAYSAIIAVYLVVAGLSAKWGITGKTAPAVDASDRADNTPDAVKGERP